jgi:glycosyltransferase involved in cell wall biosynthesis
MKVLYDHQIFEDQNIGGISRYFTELIKFNSESVLSLKYSDNLYLKDKCFKNYRIRPKNNVNDFLFSLKFRGKGRLLNYYNKIFKNNLSTSVKYLKESEFNVFHPTNYNPYFIKYIKRPFVLTVHDMIHELYKEFFVNDKKTILNKKRLILSSKHIIAISENTRNDLIKIFPEVKKKITVVYHGHSFQQLKESILKEKYILFTGARGGYKNFIVFLKAIAPLLIKYDFKLICTGFAFNKEENNLLNNLQITNRASCVFASDNQLSELYSKATAFVFPSLYEGFGIPILEAFASNCPALLSNTSSMPEIGGDAAVYFDPYSIEDMRKQIERVITSAALQNELIKKGQEQVKKFSWEKCAKETMEVYKKLQI